MPKFTKYKDYNQPLSRLEVLEGLFDLSGWFCNATCAFHLRIGYHEQLTGRRTNPFSGHPPYPCDVLRIPGRIK